MGSLKQLMAAGVAGIALLTVLSPAHAADYPMPSAPPPMFEDAPGIPAELGTGWYLRGDVGYVDYDKPREALGYSQGVPFDKITLQETVSVGGGIGYAFNGLFRADVTVDYRADARIKALSSGTNYVEGFSTDSLKLESTTALVNAYVDLGRWHGITPYIGAGVGVAHNMLHSYTSRVTCITDLCRANFTGESVPHPAGAKNSLAYAVMAGAAVDVGSGFKVDVGYRYLSMGESQTKLDTDGFGIKLKPLDMHEVRVGLRYMID